MMIEIADLNKEYKGKKVVAALIILAFCGSGAATITVEGEPITGFESMFKVLHIIVNAARPADRFSEYHHHQSPDQCVKY